jgi:hypothetical protein
MADIARPDFAELRNRDRLEFTLLRGALFAVFLPVAVLGHALPKSWRPLRSQAVWPHAEAWEAANTVAPFAFMR